MPESGSGTGRSTAPDLSESSPPLALYLHVPFCRVRCGYCAFHTTVDWDSEGQRRYVDQLIRHLRSISCMLVSVRTIYVGGGTPSVLHKDLVARLLTEARSACGDSLEEITIEANPQSVTREWIDTVQHLGVTRLSLGVQSLNRVVLRHLGRTPVSREKISAIREHWTGTLGLDLLVDAPGARPEDSVEVVDFGARIGVDHISAYVLTVEPGTALAQKIGEGLSLPDTAALDACSDALARHGFRRYEVSNFAKPGAECLHNLHYWNADSYLGIGSSAESTLYGRVTRRITQPRAVDTFLEHDSPLLTPHREELTADNLRLEYLMLRLRTVEGIDRGEYAARFGADPVSAMGTTLREAERKGLVKVSERSIRVPASRLSFADAAVRALA